MKYASFLLIIAFTGCKSGKFFLQEKSIIQVQKVFFEVIPSAIKEGNTFVKITITIANPNELNDVEFKGIYFKNQFAKLIQKDSTIFIASIILPKEDTLDEKQIPFILKSGEIIISYKEKKKEKFALFKVKRKDSLDSNSIPR